MKRLVLGLLLVCISTFSVCNDRMVIETIYGSTVIQEPVLIELINSNAMQRLKKINQYGIGYFVYPQEYTRYQHSIGVLFLMRHFGASLDEQVLGLLHDVSHTVFSHVADYLFNTILEKYSYQDSIFGWYVAHSDLLPILEKYGMTHICSKEMWTNCVMLKDDLPHLCADRLEYNLYGAYIEGLLNQEEIREIISHLHYQDYMWVFDDYASAQAVADVSIELSQSIWCAPWNCFIYTEGASLLKRAMDIDLITWNDFVFLTDDVIWTRLNASSDTIIQGYLEKIMQWNKAFQLGTIEQYDFCVKTKFRGIDPFVQTQDSIRRLTECNRAFKEKFIKIQQQCAQTIYIKYV